MLHAAASFFFVLFVAAPVCTMLMRITPAGILSVIHSPQFGSALNNSLVCSGTAALISLVLGLTAAICTERTRLNHRRAFGVLFVMPMLIPSISHAFGLAALFGANGMLTRLLGLNSSIYGVTGIVAGSVMYSFPVVYLMLANVLRYEDGSQHKAAEILGVPAFWRFADLTLPFLKRPLVSAFFAAFTMIITDYGVPLMIGGKTITLPVLMYNRAVGMIDYNSGSVIGAVLLLPALAAFIADMLSSEAGRTSFITDSVEPFRAKAPALAFCVLLAVLIAAPVIAFAAMTFARKLQICRSLSIMPQNLSGGAQGFTC